MIAELVATMALEGGYQELAQIVHPHPTISEAIPKPREPSTAGRFTPERRRATFYFDLGRPTRT